MRGLDTSKSLFKSLKEGELRGILEIVKGNQKDYFMGIRDEYINIYYMGGSLLKVSCSNQKSDKCRFEFNPKYLNGSNESIPNNDDRVDEWIRALPKLESYIRNYQEGCNLTNKEKKEKIAQQGILINNNSCIDSDYFITDMEYSCPGIGYGRFDYIAINKNKDLSGKHRLALIELKCGTGAFGTAFEEKNGVISYGSGIVGHSYNFSRFVFGVKANNSFKREKIDKTKYETLEFLQKETVNILRNKSDLDLLDADINKVFSTIKEKDIDIDGNNIETLLICVSCGDEVKAKKSIRKYLGGSEKAKYNVGDLKLEGEISDKFRLRCLVTKDDVLDCLREQQFIDLEM